MILVEVETQSRRGRRVPSGILPLRSPRLCVSIFCFHSISLLYVGNQPIPYLVYIV